MDWFPPLLFGLIFGLLLLGLSSLNARGQQRGPVIFSGSWWFRKSTILVVAVSAFFLIETMVLK